MNSKKRPVPSSPIRREVPHAREKLIKIFKTGDEYDRYAVLLAFASVERRAVRRKPVPLRTANPEINAAYESYVRTVIKAPAPGLKQTVRETIDGLLTPTNRSDLS